MREIKFRAWDKESEIMITDDPIQSDSKTLFMLGLNNEIAIFRKKFGKHCEKYDYEFYDSFALQKQNKYILMQYTGLKDKNGVEIYEGDIVKIESNIVYWKTRKPTGETSVEFAYISYLYKEARYTAVCNDGKSHELAILSQDSIYKWYKVIGNIYENPELLKGE